MQQYRPHRLRFDTRAPRRPCSCPAPPPCPRWHPPSAARRLPTRCTALPAACQPKPPSSAAPPPGLTPNWTPWSAGWPPACTASVWAKATRWPCWRATRTASRRCALRWPAAAPCWCPSTSCSRPKRWLSSCAMRVPAPWPPTAGWPAWRARPRRWKRRCSSSSGYPAKTPPNRPPACTASTSWPPAPTRCPPWAPRAKTWRRSSTPAAPSPCPRAPCSRTTRCCGSTSAA